MLFITFISPAPPRPPFQWGRALTKYCKVETKDAALD